MTLSSSMDNIAALEHSYRVFRVSLLDLVGWQLEEVFLTMQATFTELSDLRLSSNGETLPVIPNSFLGGSAPQLLYFSLSGIPFPGLPKLLLSANHLFHLELFDIPHSGYISPGAMVTCLSALPRLSTLSLEFQSPRSRPGWESRRPQPTTRFVIPALTSFQFKGVSDYLEELVARIHAAQLDLMHITFFNQIIFDCPQVTQFLIRTPKLGVCDDADEAHLQFHDSLASVRLRCQTPTSSSGDFLINISCGGPEWQLSSIEQVCTSSLPPLSMVEDLHIEHRYSELVWDNGSIENTLWLQLLSPFTAVKNLYLSEEFAPGIAAALQELVGARLTEVLPSLQNIFLDRFEPSGPFPKNVEQFVTERRLSAHPVAVSNWDKVPT